MSARPWVVHVGPTKREVTYSSREAAVGAAVTRVYNSSIGQRGFVRNRDTDESVSLVHMHGHVVRVQFHASKGE